MTKKLSKMDIQAALNYLSKIDEVLTPSRKYRIHTDREQDLGLIERPIKNETIGPLYTFIGTKKSCRKNLEKMDLQGAAPTVRVGAGSSGTVRNQNFGQISETKYVRW